MRFGVLGPIEVDDEGIAIPIVGPQQRRLLAVLIADRGQVVSTDRLVEALWAEGEAGEGAGRSVLTYVSRLRATLGGRSIVTRPPGYLLDLNDGTCDIDEFEGLLAEGDRALPERALECYDAALRLWRGEPFGEYSNEWWALAESTRLTERHVVTREERARSLMALGAHHHAVADLEGLVAEHPLRERPVSLLMQALQASGRQAEALRAYQSFRRHLADETGLAPSAELIRVERSISANVEHFAAGSSGRPLRGYVIHEAIGEGAFGRVYAATQPGTNRRVAIKAIRPDVADSASFIRRFEAEAQLVARLEHPHILPLYDYWREPGGAYLVFRLLAGGTARDAVVAGGTWSLPRVGRLVEEVGAALMAAHAAGVTHNDVKSSNVLLDADGAAYLADFGIALELDESGDGTTALSADIRGFGWLIWELLAGDLAPVGSTGLSSRHGAAHAGPTPSLVGRVREVPAGLDAVLARATATLGGYRSVAEVVLGWRAATGRPDGALTPIDSDERRAADSARRVAAGELSRAAAAGINPYKGLRPFDEGDAAGFCGRAAVIEELVDRLDATRFLTVVGASGSGKSSLIRAGLAPRLRAAGRTVVTMVPGDRPLDALLTALREVSVSEADTTDPLVVLDAVAAVTGPVVLLVDQFEECWTRCHADRRDDFLQLVAAVVGTAAGTTKVVTTVRADLFDRPLEDPHVGHHVGAGAFVLAPLSPADLGEVITVPAARAGVRFDDAVVADLVAGAASQAGGLPLLQFTLTELYDRRVDGFVGAAALASVGGMVGAIGRRADGAYASLDPAAQDGCRELFGRLVVPGTEGIDARRRARHSELSPNALVAAEAFVAARLLVTDRDPTTREPTFEVAHEALLSRWTTLAGWIDDDRRWLTQLSHLADAARSWDDNGRPASELYRGARLESAIESIDENGRAVSALEQAFVHAGRDERDADVVTARRQARRLRRLLAAVAAALVVALVAGGLAIVQGRAAVRQSNVAATERRRAEITALTTQSVSLRSTQRDLAALLAVEAYGLTPDVSSRSALFAALTHSAGFLGYLRYDGQPGGAGLTLDDGRTMLVGRHDGSVVRVDAQSGDVTATWGVLDPASLGPLALQSLPGGEGIVQLDSLGKDSSLLAVRDPETGDPIVGPVEVPLNPGSIAVSPDGDHVAVGGGVDGHVIVYATGDGSELGRVDGAPRPVGATFQRDTAPIAYLSDGRLLIGNEHGQVRVVETPSMDVVQSFELPATSIVGSWRVAPDDSSAVVTGLDTVSFVDLVTGEERWRLDGDEGATCPAAAVAWTAERLYCGDSFGRLEERSLRTSAPTGVRLDSQLGAVGALEMTPDERELVSFSGNAAVVSRWRIDGSGLLSHLVAPGYQPREYVPVDGRLLVEVAPDTPGTIVDAATGELNELGGLVNPQASPTKPLLYGITIGASGELLGAEYDLPTGKVLRELEFPSDTPPVEGRPDPSGRWFDAVFPDGVRTEVIRFDLEAGGFRRVATVDFAATNVWSAAAGSLIVVMGQPATVVIDAATGGIVRHIKGVFNGAVAGDLLIGSAYDGPLTVHDLGTGALIATLPGSRGYTQDLFVSADGATLLAQGGDNTVSLYDLATMDRIGDPVSTVGQDSAQAALRPDGLEMALGAGSRGIAIWDLDPQHWLVAACQLAGRNLTPVEWDTYLAWSGPYRETCPTS